MQSTTRPPIDWPTILFLACAWLGTTAATLWFAGQTTSCVPKFDEWPLMVPALCGGEPLNLAWFWGQINEHRIPLPRLVYLAAFYGSGGDFRSGAFLSVALLSLVALGAIILARRWRGGSSAADAFFPLMLLHWGQAQTFLLSVLVNFSVTLVFLYAALFVVLDSPGPLSVRRGVVLALSALGMIGSSLAGMIVAVPLLLWMGLTVGRRLLRRELSWPAGLALVLAITVPIAVIGVYFVGWQRAPVPGFRLPPPGHPVWLRLKNAACILAMSLGWEGRACWPAAVALLTIAGTAWAALLAQVLWTKHEDRERASAIVAFGAGLMLLIAALSCGRAFFWGEELWSTTRYASLSIPLLVVLYLTVLRWSAGRPRAMFQGILCGLAGLVFAGHCLGFAHYPYDRSFARSVRNREAQFVRDLFSRKPTEDVARDFFASENKYSVSEGARWIHMLRSSALGPFANRE